MSKITFTTQEYYAGETIVPPATAPTKSGYKFMEWTGFPANMIMPAENITVTAVFDEISSVPITFASSDVKQRLVENIDTDNDGEISFGEAAAVTNINDLKLGGVSGTFNEFKYFTGITYLYTRNLESSFTKITEITVPPSVQYINGFYNSTGHGINLKLNFDSSETYNFRIMSQGLQGLYAGTTVPCDLILPEGCTQLDTYAFL